MAGGHKKEIVAQRREDVADLLVTRTRTQHVVRAIGLKYNVAPSTVYADINAIYGKWKHESKDVDRQDRIESLRQSANDLYQKCINNERVVRNFDGAEVGREPDPRYGPAARMLELLAKMDGLLGVQVEAEVQAATEKMLESIKYQMEPEAYAQLIRAIANTAPAPPVAKSPPDTSN